MYKNITQLLEEGLFWKSLGRHERAFRYFSEVTEREPGMGRAWTERMESAAIWMGSLTLVRDIYGKMSECLRPEDKAYPVWVEQAVEFAPDAGAFKTSLKRLRESGLKPDMFRVIDEMCHDVSGNHLEALLSSSADDTLFIPLLAEFHGRRVNPPIHREAGGPRGSAAIHCLVAAECLKDKNFEEERALLLNAQNALLECHQHIEGVARSHGSKIASGDEHSLSERICVLEKLDRDYSPDDPLVLNRLGASHLLLLNSDDAISAFDRAISLENRPKPHINKASALNQKGWREATLHHDFEAAKRCFEKALAELDVAEKLPLEPGDIVKLREDKKVYTHILALISTGTALLYPSEMIMQLASAQTHFADQYMKNYRKEGADVRFIVRQVTNRFKLSNQSQAMQCANEMLEDFCPSFVALILKELGESASPLVKALTIITQDESAGVMSKDACETLAILVLLGGDDVKACAKVARRISEVSGINLLLLETWLEAYLEKGFGQSVYSIANHLPSGEWGKHSKSGMAQETTSRQDEEKKIRPGCSSPLLFISLLGCLFVLGPLILFALDAVMEPVLSAASLANISTDFVVKANRSRLGLYVFAYCAVTTLSLVILRKHNGASFRKMGESKILLLAFPLLMLFLSLNFASRNYDLKFLKGTIEGHADALSSKRLTLRIDEVDPNRSRISRLSGLMLGSSLKQTILLPSPLFHSDDQKLLLAHINMMVNETRGLPQVDGATSVSGVDSKDVSVKRTSGWAWFWGLFAFPVFAFLALLVSSALNNPQRYPMSREVFERRANLAILCAACGAVAVQIVVALMLVFGTCSATPVFWGLWVLAFIVSSVVMRKSLAVVFHS